MKTSSRSYAIAMVVALGAALLLAWLSLGVGIIGTDGDRANLMYFGVLAVGTVGAILARFRARGMVWAMIGVALTQLAVGVLAVLAGMGLPWSPPPEILALTGVFVALWLASAWLFRNASRMREDTGASGPDSAAHAS